MVSPELKAEYDYPKKVDFFWFLPAFNISLASGAAPHLGNVIHHVCDNACNLLVKHTRSNYPSHYFVPTLCYDSNPL